MIRDAEATDIPGIISLLEDGYKKTHYAENGLAQIDVPYTKQLLLLSIVRHGQTIENSTWVQVVERKRLIVGMMLASLARVYVIGNRLMASDVLFHVNKLAAPSDAATLALNMVAWARRSPFCVEIRCGTTAVHGDPTASGKMLEKLGLKPYGNIYRLELQRAA